jgi:ABC-2 type transport system permease protein
MVVHGDKLRWLFWLRLRMLTRGFRRNRASLIGSIVFLLFVLVGAGLAAFGSFAAYRDLSQPANFEVLYLVLTGLLLLWIVLPLMEFASNEGLDLSKLQLFPLTRAEMMISLLFSTLLDIPTVGLLILLGAVVIGWRW